MVLLCCIYIYIYTPFTHYISLVKVGSHVRVHADDSFHSYCQPSKWDMITFIQRVISFFSFVLPPCR